jgi:branched-subunit amino acid ABC-type transport system permease component
VILGISPDSITRLAIGLGSALAGIAGVLSALDFDMTPTMGFRLLMNGVVVMIIAE